MAQGSCDLKRLLLQRWRRRWWGAEEEPNEKEGETTHRKKQPLLEKTLDERTNRRTIGNFRALLMEKQECGSIRDTNTWKQR